MLTEQLVTEAVASSSIGGRFFLKRGLDDLTKVEDEGI